MGERVIDRAQLSDEEMARELQLQQLTRIADRLGTLCGWVQNLAMYAESVVIELRNLRPR